MWSSCCEIVRQQQECKWPWSWAHQQRKALPPSLVALLAAAALAGGHSPSAETSRGEWCRRACQGVALPPCPAACPPPTVNVTCPRPRCPAPPRPPPCPACSVTCPEPVCPAPVCPQPVCPACPAPAAPADAAAGRAAPAGFEAVPGAGAYRVFHELPLDWMSARAACVQLGAHLAIPNSQAEAGILVKNLNAHKLSWAHIGFNDLAQEGQFTTVLGQPLEGAGYARWGPGQPNGGRDQNCGFMWSDGQLADGACSTSGAYICEHAFVPLSR